MDILMIDCDVALFPGSCETPRCAASASGPGNPQRSWRWLRPFAGGHNPASILPALEKSRSAQLL